MVAASPKRADRYAEWIERHCRAVLIAAIVLAVISGVASSRLALRTNFATLLPPNAPSVVALNQLKGRIRAFGSLFVVIRAPTAKARTAAEKALLVELDGLPADLVARVSADDGPIRRFAFAHRYLLAPMDDLIVARDALAERIKKAKLEANPLYIDLDDEPEEPDNTAEDRLEKLRERLDRLEREAAAPTGHLSDDGTLQVIEVRATFPASEVSKGRALARKVDRITARVRESHPQVELGLTGNVWTTLEEHESILRGMLLAAGVTMLIVAIALLLYYRSLLAVMTALWSLTVGSIATFAVTELAIGHLNLATAFLGAIVVGNGINANLILLARYFEELRAGIRGRQAIASAIAGTARGTLAAAVTAGVAYASLMVTEFRGFRHFGFIGSLGMVLCWLAAYSVLPAGLLWLERRGQIRAGTEPAIGRLLARLIPERPKRMAIACTVLIAVAGFATWKYVASDPLQENWGKLKSSNADLERAHEWNRTVSREIKGGPNQNLSGRFAVATRSAQDARTVAKRLRAIDRNVTAKDQRTFAYVRSWDDLVPPKKEQQKKIALLGEIRRQIDEVLPELEEKDAETARRVQPPASIAPITDADVPEELAWLFVENSGQRGRILFATNGKRFRSWNVRDLVQFSTIARGIDLPEGAVIGGQAFVFADMLRSMERDGPLATIVALVGSTLMVFLIVGWTRHGLVTLTCALTGTLGMIALVSLFGVKVNFLDFIALPITVGIGLDYAVNIAARDRVEPRAGPKHLLSTTGGAVFLCSFTTTVGYGSLLLSENAGIRSFGLAAILGEISCMLAAIFLGTTLLAMFRRKPAGSGH